MRRPQSAKPGYNGYWAQGSESDLQQQQNNSKAPYRKNLKLMKPDLTTNDFARILPKKIYQDKERLYSEALQLKQNLNQTVQENIRLKTRITILQKQKDKLTKHLEVNRQNTNVNKTNSRVNMYTGKTPEKDNMMIRNLKKLVREAKEENDFLKQENAKIKKAIKYTKINELQIERKMLQQENQRIVTLLDQMNTQLLNQDSYAREISQLKRKNQYQNQAYEQLREANLKYQEYVQQLQDKLQAQGEKSQNKQNKLQRQMALNKRKLNEATRLAEDLKKELNNLKLNSANIKNQSNPLKGQLSNVKNQTQKPKLTRPMSSNPYKSQGLVGVRLTTQSKKEEQNKQNAQIKIIQLENQQLKEQLTRAKTKLQETERQMQKEKQTQPDQKDKTNRLSSNKINQDVQNSNRKTSSKKEIQETNQINKNLQENNKLKASQNNQENQDSYYNDDENYDQNYQNEFEQKKQPRNNQKRQNTKEAPQIDQYRKDFEAEEEEEPLYIKQESPKKKSIKENGNSKQASKNQKDLKEQKDQSNKKKKEKKQKQKQNGTFKPNKNMLSEIKQLLTYRMKAQRYPYEQLKRDIEQAQEKSFSFSDLKGMFLNEPFYLTEKYSETLIQYSFQSENPNPSQRLSYQTLLTKLRKVIEDFELIEQKEEEEMLLRIAEMVTEYPEELQTAFQKIKNGEETVAKQDLTEMFLNLELQQKYIELIIQELSLCSSDLQHLNFVGFFERFYVQNMSGVQNGQIDEEQMQSSSEQVSKNLKSKDSKKLKQIKAEFQDNDDNLAVDDGERISLGSGENTYNDNDDVVSDDGPI